jgi:hypothetical protein
MLRREAGHGRATLSRSVPRPQPEPGEGREDQKGQPPHNAQYGDRNPGGKPRLPLRRAPERLPDHHQQPVTANSSTLWTRRRRRR